MTSETSDPSSPLKTALASRSGSIGLIKCACVIVVYVYGRRALRYYEQPVRLFVCYSDSRFVEYS